MDNVKFSCEVAPSSPTTPIGCEVWIDDVCVFNQDRVSKTENIEHEFDDNDGEHVLRITLKNKLPEHTRIDEAGDILSDAMLTVSNISFDEIDCTQIVQDLAVYCHNFNGNGLEIEDQFFGDLGCNGSIELKFATPVYLWLLESI